MILHHLKLSTSATDESSVKKKARFRTATTTITPHVVGKSTLQKARKSKSKSTVAPHLGWSTTATAAMINSR